MKELHTLIKIRKNELDDLRRQLAGLEDQKEKLLQLAARIHEELQKEREAAISDPRMGGYLLDFEERSKDRQLEIAKEVIQLDAQMAQLTAAIAESFGELKKYEIVRDQRAESARTEADRREQAALDEAAANIFRRKKDGGQGS